MYSMKRGLQLLKLEHALLAGVIAALCLILPARAEEADQDAGARGLAVAQEAYDRDAGYGDSSSDLVMVLRTGSGQEARRELRIRSLEVSDTESRTLVVFDTPQDVRGTALLTHTFTDKDDDQWLFLPAVGRVKRIAGGSRSGPFMGSEFSFEDMGSQRVEKFTYNYLRTEALDGLDCHVLERYPTDKGSGYSKQIAWLDKEHLRIQKVEYFDRRDALLKTLTASGYTLHNDRHWRPGVMEMTNHQNGKSTLLEWKNYSFGNGFTARDFDQNALRSVR